MGMLRFFFFPQFYYFDSNIHFAVILLNDDCCYFFSLSSFRQEIASPKFFAQVVFFHPRLLLCLLLLHLPVLLGSLLHHLPVLLRRVLHHVPVLLHLLAQLTLRGDGLWGVAGLSKELLPLTYFSSCLPASVQPWWRPSLLVQRILASGRGRSQGC